MITFQSAKPLQAPASVKPARLFSVASGSVSPLFGASDAFENRKSHILVPAGTPLFFLHGTSSTGSRMNPLVNWFRRNVHTAHPGYVSRMPEISEATGIESVKNRKKTLPSSLLALRELGDFRYQVVNNRLKELNDKISPEGSPDEVVGDFFKVRPEDRDLLVPLIRQHLLAPLTKVPSGWNPAYRQPLQQLVANGAGKVAAELNKLNLRPNEVHMPIYDTEFLATKAELEGKKLNFDMNRLFSDPDTINIRSVTLSDIGLLEGYLLCMQTELARGIKAAYRKQAMAAGRAFSKADAVRADKTAEKLMDAIAPRALVIGHSQGGTVLMAALLNHIEKSAQYQNQPFRSLDPRRIETLAGRGVGLEVLLSAPLHGIPEIPAWGKKLMKVISDIQDQIPLVRHREGLFARWAKKIIWRYKTSGSPAVGEMRENSPLMRKISQHLDRLQERGVTVVSAFDRHDAYVEPDASRVKNARGQEPVNVFNMEVETSQLPSYFTRVEDMLTEFVPFIGPLLARHLPASWKQKIQRFYEEDLATVEQHRAMIAYPEVISQELGRQLVLEPDNQTKLLDTHNFEPLRYTALVARGKNFQRRILDQPTQQAAALLTEFARVYPQFLDVLISNAKEDLPLINSASAQATDILSKTLDLMVRIAADPSLKAEYRSAVQPRLQKILEADLPGLSQRAGEILKQVE